MRKWRYQYHSFSHRKRLAVSTGFKDHKSCENRDINIIHSLTERGWLYRQDLKTINHAKIEISISFILSRKRLVVSPGFKDHKSCENRDINIIHSLTERGWLYRQDLKTINHAKIEIAISFILSQKEVGCIDRI